MGQQGFRYIVTTLDSIYVTPSISVDKKQNQVSILDTSASGEVTTINLCIDSIIGLVKEVYQQIDVYESFIGENTLTGVL